MFPLNEQPNGLVGLLDKFRLGSCTRDFFRHQLVAGATTAFVVLRLHYPDVDLAKFGAGIPAGTGSVSMAGHYATVEGAASCVIALMEHETALELERRRLLAPIKEEVV